MCRPIIGLKIRIGIVFLVSCLILAACGDKVVETGGQMTITHIYPSHELPQNASILLLSSLLLDGSVVDISIGEIGGKISPIPNPRRFTTLFKPEKTIPQGEATFTMRLLEGSGFTKLFLIDIETGELRYREESFAKIMYPFKAVPPDHTPPTLVTASPMNESVDVKVTRKEFWFAFSESVLWDDVKVRFTPDVSVPRISSTPYLNDRNKIEVTLSNQALLSANTNYIVSLEKIKDLSNNVLKEVTIRFKTEP